METIRVWKLNHATLKIDCDSGIAAELREFFSFYVPGYKFIPSYRNRLWDGKIRLFNAQNHELPAGLFFHLMIFCKDRGYLAKVDSTDYGSPLDQNKITFEDLDKFIETLQLPYTIRDYQKQGVIYGIKHKNGILLSPTGSGKSLIIYCLNRWYIQNYSKKILIIVPTTSLVEQMYSDFEEYGFNVREYCHKIYSGKDKNTDKRLVISTWQSIYKYPFQWFAQYGMVIGDECHGFKSKSLMSIMNKSREAEYRFGTTGTLDGTQTHELVLQGLFGKTYRVTSTKKLQENDTLADLKINRIVLNYNDTERKENTNKVYNDEIDYIIKHEKRNNFIKNLAIDQKGNTLVLFKLVEKHGKPLYTIINNKASEKRKVFFVSGNTQTSDREAIRGIVEKQKNAIIVASLGTFSTGINIRNLHNIIFASPSKSQIRVLQSIGRGLRKSDNNEPTVLYDIIDDLQWHKKKNFALTHADQRLLIYEKEKFLTKTFKVDFV